MAKKVIILAGAPLCETLDWVSPSLLQNFTASVARFADSSPFNSPAQPSSGDRTGDDEDRVDPSGLADRAVWRALPLERRHLPTGFSQQHGSFLAAAPGFPPRRHHEDTDFFTTAGVSFDGGRAAESLLTEGGEADAERLLSQFCEHTLAALDGDLSSSELDRTSLTGEYEGQHHHADTTTSFLTGEDTSFASTTTGDGDGTTSFVVRGPAPNHGPGARLSDLKDVPNAAFLAGIEPQTVTANLVVGVISIAAARTVKTRWGATRSLVELLVGDDTRSGFGVTFWLPASGPRPAPAAGARHRDLEHVLAGLRPQDVVLLRNVGLGSFMRKVHGFGLRGSLTQIHLLYRRKLDAADEAGHYRMADLALAEAGSGAHPQLVKAKRVRDWVVRFVGNGANPPPPSADLPTGKRKGGGDAAGGRRAFRTWDMPPADTQ